MEERLKRPAITIMWTVMLSVIGNAMRATIDSKSEINAKPKVKSAFIYLFF